MLDAIYGYARSLADSRSLVRREEWKCVLNMYARHGCSISEIARATRLKSRRVKKNIDSEYESLMGEQQRYIFRNAVRISREMRWTGTLAAEKVAGRLREGKEHIQMLKSLGEHQFKRLDSMIRKETRRCSSAEYLKEQKGMLWRALFRRGFEVKSQMVGDFLQKEHVQTAR